jgi:hypothetical protein
LARVRIISNLVGESFPQRAGGWTDEADDEHRRNKKNEFALALWLMFKRCSGSRFATIFVMSAIGIPCLAGKALEVGSMVVIGGASSRCQCDRLVGLD